MAPSTPPSETPTMFPSTRPSSAPSTRPSVVSFPSSSPLARTWSFLSHIGVSSQDQTDASIDSRDDPSFGNFSKRQLLEFDSKRSSWDLLHGPGTTDYLYFIPGTNRFEWTRDIEKGRRTAAEYFPGSEGISFRAGLLYFVSKKLFRLFILDLDEMTYKFEDTRTGLMIGGDGTFTSHADHLFHLSDDVLYFTEDGGRTPGIYGRVTSTGHYFAVFEALAYKTDEATGLAFSPDWRRMYVCIQENGLFFEITRADGKPFEHQDTQAYLKSHPFKNHP